MQKDWKTKVVFFILYLTPTMAGMTFYVLLLSTP